mgnify:FL=1
MHLPEVGSGVPPLATSRGCRLDNMKRKRTGFSLVEVLFGVFLAMLSAMVLAASMPIATTSRARADLNNKATGLAQKQLEAIRSLGYANATPGQLRAAGLIDSVEPIAENTYSFSNVDSAALDNPSRILTSGSGRVILEQVDIDLRRATVEVRYTDGGREKSVRIGTLVANL